MPSDLWYFQHSYDFGESIVGSDFIAPLPSDMVLYRAVYLGEEGEWGATLEQARRRLSTDNFQSRDDIYVLRPTISTDGVPFRAAWIYRVTQHTDANRLGDPRLPVPLRVETRRTLATRYQALRVGGPFAWEREYARGRSCYFLTGVSETADLWRLARLEPDALGLQVLTLAPVRSAHEIAVPNFDRVPTPRLRTYLVERFDAFLHAVVSASHFDVVDRAANIAEGVLDYCLTAVGHEVPRTLGERLGAAKTILENEQLRAKFALTTYAYHLAHKIRELHARLHADQAVQQGRTVRPEVGMGLTTDISELLVEVGLARY